MEVSRWSLLRQLIDLSIPVALTMLTFHMMTTVDIIMVGRLGSQYLSAAGLAAVWTNGTIFIAKGLITAIDPLASQAYGAQNYKLVGLVLQRGLFFSAIATVPVTISWMYTENGLLLLRQDPETSRLAGEFAIHLAPSLFPTLVYDCLQKYLQAQRVTTPALVVGVICNFLNVVFNVLLIWGVPSLWSGMGFLGSPTATATTRITQAILLLGYVVSSDVNYQTWGGWSRDALHPAALREFLALGIPGAIMTVSEVWGFELSTILAGSIDIASLAAHTAILNIATMMFMIYLGMGIACSTLVGNFLGARRPDLSKRTALVAVELASFVAIVLIPIVYILRYSFAGIFTSEKRIIELICQTLPVLLSFEVFDGVQTVLNGAFRGLGRPLLPSISYFASFYVVGLPLGYILINHGWGLPGVWMGLLVALVGVATINFLSLLFRVNWEDLSRTAQERTLELPLEKHVTYGAIDIEGPIEALEEVTSPCVHTSHSLQQDLTDICDALGTSIASHGQAV